MPDPYAVLGIPRGADAVAIHSAYRRAVRRTHPDAGGTAAAFEAVQSAYETLRDPALRAAYDARSAPPPPEPEFEPMEDLLAESQRLENEARRLGGLPPRDFRDAPAESEDSLASVFDDAQRQLRDVAAAAARELRRRARRML
jgi:curved DNA-binding protein CbpA